MPWTEDQLHTTMTVWLEEQLKQEGTRPTPFSKMAGIGESANGKNDNGRTLRSLQTGKRRWSIWDINKVALYFEKPLSYVLVLLEIYFVENEQKINARIEANRKKSKKQRPTPKKLSA